MKLLLCTTCSEVFSLSKTYRECRGSHTGGLYINNLDAQYWGPKDKAFILGFANNSLVGALRSQINEGDQKPKYIPGYGNVSPGREFTAFIIPDSASSLKRYKNRTDSEFFSN